MIKYFMKSKKGFTLVELMVVVVILGILVAIAVPIYNNVTTTANRRAVESNLRIIDSAITQLKIDNSTAVPSSTTLATYIQTWPTGPDGTTYSISTSGTNPKAQATKVGTPAWWGTTNSPASLPITWTTD